MVKNGCIDTDLLDILNRIYKSNESFININLLTLCNEKTVQYFSCSFHSHFGFDSASKHN